MMFSLENKSAIITGGASGIGKATATLFAQQGAIVHILEINASAAHETVAEIMSSGGKAIAHAVDISRQDQVRVVLKDIPGKIDILVNNAGVAHIGTAESTSEADFERIININIRGVYNCLHEILPRMKDQGGGVIVNMSSIAANVGLPDRFAYSMSKGAVAAMTWSVARDYVHHHIRCNSISPARVHTPFVDGFIAKNYPGNEQQMFEKLSGSQPVGRMAKPEEIAQLVLYLCSDEASFVTGTDYPIDGGFVRLRGS